MRKDTSEQEKQKDLHWWSISGDERMLTHLFVRICSNSGLNTVKNRHELQHAWRSHKHGSQIRWTYRENKDTFLMTETVTRARSGTRFSHEEREFTVDPGASLHIMTNNDLIHEEKETIRKSTDQSLRQKKLMSTSEIWTCLSQSNYLKIQQQYSRQGNYAKNIGIPTNEKRQIHQLQDGKFFTDSRGWRTIHLHMKERGKLRTQKSRCTDVLNRCNGQGASQRRRKTTQCVYL